MATLPKRCGSFIVLGAEMKSEDRDEWMKYLKFAGKYNEEYDM